MATNNDNEEENQREIPIKELKDNLIALKEFSLCLDRVFKQLLYWSHLAYVLNIDNHVIRQCELYLEESPTIKLFEYLKSTKGPGLTIKDLKDALKAIDRVDIYITINESFKDEDKVSEVITDSSSDIMDTIALELDSASKPIGNWEKLAQKLEVPRDIYQKFAMYSDYNPTVSLVRYLYTSSEKTILMKDFMDCFQRMGRQDVISEVETSIELDDSTKANEVLKVGSDLLQKIANLLNRKSAIVGGWRELGSHFNVELSIMDSLEPPRDKEVHSPTTKVINWLAAARPSTTINDVAKALEKIKRYDALKILTSRFDIDLISFDESNTIGFGNVPDGLGHVAGTGDDDADTGYDADTSADVDRRSATPPNTPKMSPKAPCMFSIQATEQSSTRIFQGDVLKFGLPSKSKHLIINREKEKEELITNLTDPQNEMVVLHATPGCGKTTLVVTVAHDIIKYPHRYTVVYVDSKNVFSLEDLAYKILTTCGIASSSNHPVAQVIDLFSHSNQDCVLILENLDHMYHSTDKKNQTSTSQTGSTSDQESLWQITFKKGEFQDFLKDVTKSAPNLKVLVTTWEPIQFLSIKVKQMTLNLFDRDQSLELLELRSKIPLTNQPDLEPIIKCCGGIPLLLCAAGVFLSDSDSVQAACKQFASSPPQKQLGLLCQDSLPVEERLNHCLGKCFERMNVCSREGFPREVLVLLSVFPNLFTLKEAQHIAKGSKIDEDKLKEGFQLLKKFFFLNTYDVESEKYVLHPAVRSFGISKAKQDEDLKTVFEAARCRYIFYTFDILSEIEKEFFSTQSKSAIQKYRLQDDNIREIARWCITDSSMDVKMKQFCIQSLIHSQFVLLKTMRSYPLKHILREFAQVCQKNEDIKLYCDCLTLRGAKIVFGCLCTPYLCPTALMEADSCFCKVIEALVEDDGNESQDKQENIDHIYKSEVISDKAKAQFLLKYGKCLVRHGYNLQGINSIEKGIDVRKSKSLSNNVKNRAMLAMGYEDLAGAHRYKGERIKAISIREQHVLPTFCKELGIHPFTATAHSQLARNYFELCDYDKAVQANEIALRYRKTLLGDHQDTARSLFDHGAILSEQGKVKAEQSAQFFEEALSYFQQALELQNRVVDTPQETALTHQELAFVLTQLGREEEAEQQMQRIEENKKMKATIRDDLSRFPKSTNQEGDAVGNTGTEREPATSNSLTYIQDTARSLFDKGVTLSEQAQAQADQSTQLFEEALSYFQQALDMQKRVLDTPEETAITHQELAFVLTQLGREEEAEQQMHTITECLKKVKETTQDDLPRFPKSTNQEGDAVVNTETERESATPNASEGSSTGSNTRAQVNKSAWLANAIEFIKEKFGLTSGDNIDDVFGEYENFALEYRHQVFVSDLEETLRLQRSIGLIFAMNISNVKVCGATCFRIGTKYVITNKHVVDEIYSLGINSSNCYVDFNYKKEGQPDYFRFTPNPVLVFSEELDYVILELYSNGGESFPPSVTELGFNISPGRQLKGGECLAFIGHPGGMEKQIDVSCPIKHQQDIQKYIHKPHLFCMIQNAYNHPGYATYDVSTFFWGSSGSPGVLMEEKLLVVLQSGGIIFPGTSKHHVLEYGTLMSSVVKDVMAKINNDTTENVTRVLDEIFGGSTSSSFI